MYDFETLLIYMIIAFIIGYLVREVFDIIAINEYLMKKGEKKNGSYKRESRE